MNKRTALICFLVLLFVGKVWSQQTPLYSQYYLNPYLYNPAYAGQTGTQAFFQYRKQWVGVDGSPETQVFTLDSQLKNDSWGVGLTFFNDVSNVIGRTNVALSAAHTIQLAQDQTLSFGLSAMLIQNKIFFDRVQVSDNSDPNLLNNMNNRTVYEMNAGFSYTWKHLNVGIAGDQLLQSEITYENAAQFQSLRYKYVRHYIATLSYDFILDPSFTLKPLILTRIVEGLSPKMDAGLVLDYQNLVWIGGSYRHKIGAGGAVGFRIDERFVVGYSYEVPTSDLKTIGAGSHEFVIGLSFGGGSSVRKSTSPTTSSYSNKRAVKQEMAVQYEKMDQLESRNRQNEEKLEQYEALIDRQEQELSQLKALYGSFEDDLKELKQQNAVAMRSQLMAGEAEEQVSDNLSLSEQYFVIVGAFRKFENAKRFQKVLKRDAELETRVEPNNEQTWFLISSLKTNDRSEALKALETLKGSEASKYIIGEPWVFIKESNQEEAKSGE